MVKRRLSFVVATCMAMCAVVAGESRAQNGAPDKPAKIEALYGGSRATALLAAQIKTKDGKSLGQIRNLILRGNGKIDSIISEQTGLGVRPEFVIRIP